MSWIVTPRGDFLSAVAATENDEGDATRHGKWISLDKVCVRARCREDLGDLLIFGKSQGEDDLEIVEYAHSDYPYRVIMPKALWKDYVWEVMEDVTYTNFKSHIGHDRGHARSSILSRVWSALLSLEDLDPALKAEKDRKRKLATTYTYSGGGYGVFGVGGSEAAKGYPWARGGAGSQTTPQAPAGGTAAGNPTAGLTAEDRTLEGLPVLAGDSHDIDAAIATALDEYDRAGAGAVDVYAREHGSGAWWSDVDQAEAGARAAADDLAAEAHQLHEHIATLERQGRGRGKKARRARRDALVLRRKLSRLFDTADEAQTIN